VLPVRRSIVVLLSAFGLFVGVLGFGPSGASSYVSGDATTSRLALAHNPLAVPGVEWFDGGQQASDQAVAKRVDPGAVFAREVSRTAYSHLSAAGVGRLLSRSFPAAIDRPAGGAGAVPAGAHVLGYPSAHAIDVSLPGHTKGIVESSAPVAKRGTHGRFTPIDLAIAPVADGYAPANSALAVRIPKQISAGVSIPANGVTLTPVGVGGRPLGGMGSVVHGASVVYANTQGATDTVVKPTTTGFQIDAVLRSVSSPQRLYYRVGAPAGSRLVLDRRSGAVRVVRGGATLAAILPPGAVDAAETSVPTSMSVAGHTVVVSVAHRAGSYLYPIDVDPEVNDSQLAETTSKKRSNWEFKSTNEARFGHKMVYEGAGKERLETSGIAQYVSSEFAYWAYETKGNSKIYELKTKTSAKNKGAKVESFLEFQAAGTHENKKMLSNETEEPEYGEKTSTICAWNASKIEECLPGAGKEKNVIRFQQSATTPPGSTYAFSDTMSEGVVSISEPSGEHSTTNFNTTSSEVEGVVEGKTQKRVNALYGSGIWLTNTKGALQMIAKDPGIGVSATHLEYEKSAGSWERLSEHNYLEVENACQGVQCYAEHAEYWTLDPKLPDGEDKIRYRAQEAIAGTESLPEEAESTKTIKVDTKAPYAIHLIGLPWGNELTEKQYALTTEATDGEGSTVASSGIPGVLLGSKGEVLSKGVALYVDGREVSEAGTQTGCTAAKGACTAKVEWTINGAELGAGHHAIVIVTIDRAGNEKRAEYTLSVRHSTPVAVGPGSLDLQSGDFSLGATDVSMGSGLTVGRNYSSRVVTSGTFGALGPQWNLSLGNSESLSEMVDGGVLFTDSTGKQTIFAALGEGRFESPNGDENLELTLEENKETKQKLAYYLKDQSQHTSVKFTQMPSSSIWVPTKQEGTVATDTVTYSYQASELYPEYSLPAESRPSGLTAGPNGNTWFVEHGTNKIGEVTPTGKITEFNSKTTEPEFITEGPDGNLWYTSNVGEISSMTPTGTAVKLTSVSGGLSKITSGPDGKMWFVETGADKIGKIATKVGGSEEYFKEYPLPAGSKPFDVAAGPDGNLWVAEWGTGKIARVTTSGAITEYALPSGSHPDAITQGPDGNLWFTEEGTKKIAKITTAGSVTEYSLPSEILPGGSLIVGSDKSLWLNDYAHSKIARVTTTGVATLYSLPSESYPKAIAPGSDGNIWFGANYSEKIGAMPITGTTVEPTEILAPKPTGVSCEPELKAGCRSLTFTYASETTATGEVQSQWGSYRGHLETINLHAYDPVSKKMTTTWVAKYSYDTRGRLREERDPRISPTLLTTYGYDSESHVTALTTPGQESWAFTYGAIAGDAGTGRLLKAMQAPASTELWNGQAVSVTELPQVSGPATEGVRLAASRGKWSGSPIAYGYQWQDCNSAGAECVSIAGASNPNYTPTSGDVGHTIRVKVLATNGDGSENWSSAATAVVQTMSSRFTEYATGASTKEITKGPDENLWVGESGGKIAKVTTSGAVTTYTLPVGSVTVLTAGPDGNVWFTDELYEKIGKITTSGVITEYSISGSPRGITAGPDGNLWFTDVKSQKIGKITTAGVVTEYGSGIGAERITLGPDGNLWFTDTGKYKVGKITTAGVITEYTVATTGLHQLTSIVSGPDGNVWFTDAITKQIDKVTTSGTVSMYTVPFSPWHITAAADNKLWYTSSGGLGSITTSGVTTSYGVPGGAGEGLTYGPDGAVWYSTLSAHKVGKVSPALLDSAEAKSPEPGITVVYGTSLSSGGGRPDMTSTQVAKWGQTDVPVEATAIFPTDEPQGWPASSYKRAAIHYLDAQGREVNVAGPSNATYGSVSTTEYNETNDVVRTLSPDNRQTALEAGSKSVDVAKSLSTYMSYREECSKESENRHETESNAPGARLCDVEGPQHTIKYMVGSEQKESLGRLHTKYFYDEEAPGGETYNLQTTSVTLAELSNEAKEEVEGRVTKTSYSGQSNLGWKLRAPTSVTVDPEGKKLTTTTLYNSSTGQVTETRAPAGSGGGSPHDTKLIYYTAEANGEGYSTCGGHPEWAGLLCETLPAKQPETGGVPNLPVTTTTYNMYNEPLVITETFGATVRTKTKTYDEAGRLATSETTSTANTALPKLTDEYNSKTGVLEKLSTTVEAKTQTITSKYNTVGQLTEYTDADGNITKYRYAGPENDGLLEEVADGSNSGAGKQTYSYNSTTKQLEELTDSSAGVFKASYDAEGRLTSEVYPNAMCADNTYNEVGEATKVEYIKTTNCSEHSAPVWFSETRNPSVRGETLSRSNTLASESYAYDSVGRLTEAKETPAAEGCSVRLYGYDEESNRTSQTTRAPGGGGACATEGGTVLNHTYDAGNRLTDSGVAYDSFGNLTKVPAADAEGHELSSSFYVSGAVVSQTQNGVTNNYYLDPKGRIRETVNGASATISHYDGAGGTVVWTSETGGKSTRNIPGIDGSLAAVQTNGETPVLQLHDLQGDIAATAALSPSETKVLSTYNSTEFGVPNKEKAPPKFAWLGAGGIASSLSSGVITYGATSYVPQIGRALQSEVVEAPGIAPGGTGAGAAYVSQEEPWVFQGAAAAAAEAPGLEAAREREAAEAAASVVDPWVTHLMNRKKAIELGETYWEAESIAVVLSMFDLPADFVDLLGKIAGEFVSQVDDAFRWLHDAGEKLVGCGKNKWTDNLNICRFSYDQDELKLEVLGIGQTFKWPNFSVEPRVEECKYGLNATLFCFHTVGITDREL
jgi:YD repeat-containing protein